MRLNPKHLTLNELLLGRLFRIPEYQRAYAWGKKQRDELFQDIREVRENGQDHFMATIVSLARGKRTIGADEFISSEVVDGQQRLTTFVILLKAIEKSLRIDDKLEAKIKSEIADLLVKADDHSLVLLQTNHDSSSVFLDYIRAGVILSDPPVTAADKNLVDAAMECEAFVSNWATRTTLVELIAILRNRLSMIFHELTDEAAVYRVFEVLNSRGLDVRWIDKCKSQLMGLIHARFLGASILLREFPKNIERSLMGHWERVTFRIFGLGGADTRNKNGEYVRLAYDILTEKLSDEAITDRLRELGRNFSIDEVLTGTKDYYQSYEGWTEELRYLLFRYDEYLARQTGEKISQAEWTKIWAADPSKSIEHIKPQSSQVSYVHHLGNLTMLPPGVNSSLQDKTPKQKATKYREHGIRATREVADSILKSPWDEKAVLARAKKIEKFIRQEWAD